MAHVLGLTIKKLLSALANTPDVRPKERWMNEDKVIRGCLVEDAAFDQGFIKWVVV